MLGNIGGMRDVPLIYGNYLYGPGIPFGAALFCCLT
jgi:hypothetical protein